MTHYLTVEIPVPDEATHIAQDKTGQWNFFEGEPVITNSCYWYSKNGIGYLGPAYQDKPPANWRDQCYEIERK